MIGFHLQQVPPQPVPSGPTPPMPGPGRPVEPITDPTQEPPPVQDPDVVDPVPGPVIMPPLIAMRPGQMPPS